MNSFAMLGNYVSQGVYAVVSPFQGAVDIVVVQQEDGTFKSSPWYVKYGNIQGALVETREKIVDISVNGVRADFYMLLNNKGEAYFEKEVEDATLALHSALSADDQKEVGQTKADDIKEKCKRKVSACLKSVAVEERSQVQETSCADSDSSTQGNGANQTRGLLDDFQWEGPSGMQEPPSTISGDSCDSGVAELSNLRMVSFVQRSNLQEVAEVDLARKDVIIHRNINLEVRPAIVSIDGYNLNMAEAHSMFLDHLAQEEISGLQQVSNIESDLETKGACNKGDSPLLLDGVLDVETADVCAAGDNPSLLVTDDGMVCKFKTVIAEDWFGLQKESSVEATCIRNDLENSDAKLIDELIWNDYKIVTDEEEKEMQDALNTASVVGLDGDNWKSGVKDERNAERFDSSVWISNGLVNEDTSKVAITISEDNSLLVEEGSRDTSIDNVMLDKDVVCKLEAGSPTERSKGAAIPTIAVVPPPSRWTMWPLPFRRSRDDKAPISEATVTKQALLAASNIAVGSPLTEEILRKNGYGKWPLKPKVRTFVPTAAQIESLELKEGPNKVTFTFPRVLGKAQVDAHIYLWKWNTRIVISDVDGTITKSDVLGQVMPLVGRDWCQSGVTRLFSAIKENGYEVLFLSARAISQAYLTRQFLVNLKQDGETLPKGPVFISPDGLIPSLYREVIRRAPHEFKISCLEGIRRLFPSDVNPFYAGFGNRHTDEISYRKVGIPKGKIFTVNPKGEIMVNHHVDVKSYTSIHALVDDMFPPVLSSEQEDFNSWNYWKLPLPNIVDGITAKSSKTKKCRSSKTTSVTS